MNVWQRVAIHFESIAGCALLFRHNRVPCYETYFLSLHFEVRNHRKSMVQQVLSSANGIRPGMEDLQTRRLNMFVLARCCSGAAVGESKVSIYPFINVLFRITSKRVFRKIVLYLDKPCSRAARDHGALGLASLGALGLFCLRRSRQTACSPGQARTPRTWCGGWRR